MIKKLLSYTCFPRINLGLLLLVWYVSAILPTNLIAQNPELSQQLKAIIDSTKKFYGSSDLLVNGSIYFQEHKQANGSPYLFSPDFIKGGVFTNEMYFDGCHLSYDIVSQQLILLTTMPNGARLPISLDNTLIDSFMLYNYQFVNASKLVTSIHTAFVLAVNEGANRLVLAYTKQFINQYNQTTPFGKFSNSSRTMYYITDKETIRINSKKAFIRLFPEIKKEISLYFKNKKVKIKSASPEQLNRLMNFCDTQMGYHHE